METKSTSHTSPTPVPHADPDAIPERQTNIWATRVSRVSWGAILAGFFSAVAIQLTLSLLGLAFGFWSIDPQTETYPFSGLGVGAGIWWVATGIISLFIGGWLAGRLAGWPNRTESMLQGVVVWGLLTVASFWFAGSAMGSLLNATTDAIGSGLAVLGDYAVPDESGNQRIAATEQANGQQTTMRFPSINYDQIAAEFNEILQETGKDQLDPSQLKQAEQQLMTTAQEAATTVLKRPDSAQQQLDRVLNAFYSEVEQFRDALDQEAIANVITANTDVSEEEANRIVDRWQNEYQEMAQATEDSQQKLESQLAAAGEELQETYQTVKQETLQTSEQVLDSVAYAAFWSFLSLALGLGSAVAGGALGVPEPRSRVERS